MFKQNMSVQEVKKLLEGICATHREELASFKKNWPNPTSKQARRIAFIQQKLDEAEKTLEHIQKIFNQ